MENLVNIEVAEKEWISFLEENDATGLIPNAALKEGDKQERDEYEKRKGSFDRIAKAISTGHIVINNGVVTQKLKYPIKSKDGEKFLDELVYGERWTAKDREDVYRGLNTESTSDMFLASRRLGSKLTGIDAGILQKLDSADMKIFDIVVSVFFM